MCKKAAGGSRWFLAMMWLSCCQGSGANQRDGGAPGAGGNQSQGGQSGSVVGGQPSAGTVAGGAGGLKMGGNTGGNTSRAGAALFPASSPWYQDITNAPLDAESVSVIAGLASRGGWGAGSFRIDFSIEVMTADAQVVPRTFTKTDDFYEPDCDDVPIPVPPQGRIEGEQNYACASDGDCHLIVIQGMKLFEMWRASIPSGTAAGNPFMGGCLVVWDRTRDYWKTPTSSTGFARGEQCTSADAAGFPIAALLFSADEVAQGTIDHAIRFILPNDRIRLGEYVHPATHSGAGKGAPTLDRVPYGARFRLKASFSLASLPTPGARTVARALQRYGMFLADGGNIALTAQADTFSTAKWEGLLGSRDLSTIAVTDFEMIDGGPRIPLTLDCVRAR